MGIDIFLAGHCICGTVSFKLIPNMPIFIHYYNNLQNTMLVTRAVRRNKYILWSGRIKVSHHFETLSFWGLRCWPGGVVRCWYRKARGHSRMATVQTIAPYQCHGHGQMYDWNYTEHADEPGLKGIHLATFWKA